MQKYYFLDANIFITAKHVYYQFDRVPEFWDFLSSEYKNSSLKMSEGVHREIVQGDDDLVRFANYHKDSIVKGGELDPLYLEIITSIEEANKNRPGTNARGKIAELDDRGRINLENDIRLIADAANYGGIVVTNEVGVGDLSKKDRGDKTLLHARKKGSKVPIPNICHYHNIEWMTFAEFLDKFEFATSKSKQYEKWGQVEQVS